MLRFMSTRPNRARTVSTLMLVAKQYYRKEDKKLAAGGFQMNWKKGRLWIAVSVLWMIFPTYLLTDQIRDPSDPNQWFNKALESETAQQPQTQRVPTARATGG